MKLYREIGFFWLLMFMLQIMSCSHGRNEIQPAVNDSKWTVNLQKDSLDYVVDEIRDLIKLGNNSLAVKDSIGALAYFENANKIFLEIDASTRKKMLADSSFNHFFEARLSKPYELLRNSFSYLNEDTTSTDEVQQELETYFKTEDKQADTVDSTESYDKNLEIPEEINKKVKLAIKYFTTTTRGRRVMSRWLQRATRFEKLFKGILKEEGVPEDLFYLALIESGLNPRARSYARAVGPWQFIASTGKAYGLHSSFWYDDRSDYEKSTRAAARHLKDLYQSFGDWYFAMAGYNYSPRKLKRRIRQYKADSFWEVKRLPRQTRNYVPTYIAARHIAKNAQAYGFIVDSLPPLAYDTVHVRESIDLTVVAKMVDTTYKSIRELNPAIRRWVTPPDVKEWVLNIPKNTKEKFKMEYAKIPDSEKRHYVRHRVRQGQTLSHISYRYGVPIWLIKKYNKIRGNLIRMGQNLIIPVPANRKAYYASSQKYKSTKSRRRTAKKPVIKGKEKIVYQVKMGDNLFDISQEFGVTVSRIRYWNNLGYSRYIYPGQKLNIWLPKEVATVKKENKAVDENSVAVLSSAETANGEKIIYTVKRGDTLWDIARSHNTSIHQIKAWNKRKNNKIKPGEKLIIYK